MSEVRMLCQICGFRPATHTCPLCGRAVCDSDFDNDAGVCKSCKKGKRVKA